MDDALSEKKCACRGRPKKDVDKLAITLNVRVDAETYRSIKALADRDERSMSDQTRILLRDLLQKPALEQRLARIEQLLEQRPFLAPETSLVVIDLGNRHTSEWLT